MARALLDPQRRLLAVDAIRDGPPPPMTPPIPRHALQDTVIGFKPEPPEAIVVDDPTPIPRAPEPMPHPEPRLTDSPAFLLLMWTLIGLMVGIAWTL